MSPSSSDSDDPAAITTGDPASSGERTEASAGNGSSHPIRSPSGATAATGRLTRDLDRRLQGLHAEQSGRRATQARADQRRRRRHIPPLVQLAAFVAAAAVIVLLLHAFIIQPFSVPGDAMAPTLQAGDRVLVLKSSLLSGSLHSGQIIVFHPPTSMSCSVVGGHSGDLVLRVVATPGDVIWSVGNRIMVDGEPLREKGWYNPGSGELGSTPIRSTALGRSQYFVLADNRADACDSRDFGPIARSSVVGRAIAIVGRHGHVSIGAL